MNFTIVFILCVFPTIIDVGKDFSDLMLQRVWVLDYYLCQHLYNQLSETKQIGVIHYGKEKKLIVNFLYNMLRRSLVDR